VFLPRHGKGHVLSPSDINYRANIDVLKRAGVTDLVSLSACGSFREDLPPGTFLLVDQFVDRTYRRESSFFGSGCVAHVSMAHPVSPRLHVHLAAAARAVGGALVGAAVDVLRDLGSDTMVVEFKVVHMGGAGVRSVGHRWDNVSPRAISRGRRSSLFDPSRLRRPRPRLVGSCCEPSPAPLENGWKPAGRRARATG